MPSLLGLDLSARVAAAVAVPTDWGGDWHRVGAMSYGFELALIAEEEDRIDRCEEIAERIVSFAIAHGCVEAWIEGYAFAQVTGAYTLGELGGIVKSRLKAAGIKLRRANMGTARSLLLGRIPRGKGMAKKAVVRTLEAAGARFATVDENEAMVCANLGLSTWPKAQFFASPKPPRERRRAA